MKREKKSKKKKVGIKSANGIKVWNVWLPVMNNWIWRKVADEQIICPNERLNTVTAARRRTHQRTLNQRRTRAQRKRFEHVKPTKKSVRAKETTIGISLHLLAVSWDYVKYSVCVCGRRAKREKNYENRYLSLTTKCFISKSLVTQWMLHFVFFSSFSYDSVNWLYIFCVWFHREKWEIDVGNRFDSSAWTQYLPGYSFLHRHVVDCFERFAVVLNSFRQRSVSSKPLQSKATADVSMLYLA